jgi:hypothetical protein
MLSEDVREKYELWKKSSDGGYHWAHIEYADYFYNGQFEVEDTARYVELLERAAKEGNSEALFWLADFYFDEHRNYSKAMHYHRLGAASGCRWSMRMLAEMYRDGQGVAIDLKQAVFWSGKGDGYLFWELQVQCQEMWEHNRVEEAGCDFDQLLYKIGQALYWRQYETDCWERQSIKIASFGERCLSLFCGCVDLQQQALWMFLMSWNQTVGVKEMGVMIAKLVWQGREDNLIKDFETVVQQEQEVVKRLKVKE